MRRKSPNFRFLPWIGALTLLGCAIFVISRWPEDAAAAFPKATGIFVLGSLFVCFPLIIRSSLRRQYRRMPVPFERRVLQADFSGLHFRAESSSTDVARSLYEAYAEDDRTFLLIQQGSTLFVPIPKGELTPGQIDDVRMTFDTYLPRR